MKLLRMVPMLVLALVLAACAGRSKTAVDDAGMVDGGPGGASASGIDGGGFGQGSEFGQEGVADTGGPSGGVLDSRVVYFAYDQSDVKPEYTEMLQAHGRYLSTNPGARLRLEGHADERGSREYNIGLGERRAQAVRRVLLLQGAAADQLLTVSFGEERPAVLGSDEEAYALNRRVELVYGQ